LFTLFVVPAFYMLLAADHHAEQAQRTGNTGLGDQLEPA